VGLFGIKGDVDNLPVLELQASPGILRNGYLEAAPRVLLVFLLDANRNIVFFDHGSAGDLGITYIYYLCVLSQEILGDLGIPR